MPQSNNDTGLLRTPNVNRVRTKHLVESGGGVSRLAKELRTSHELMQLWYTEEIDTPFASKVALWWSSAHGFNQAFRESHWTHEYNSWLKNEARGRVELLERFIRAHGIEPPPGQLTSHKEMLLAGPQSPTSYAIRAQASQPPFALEPSRSKQLGQP